MHGKGEFTWADDTSYNGDFENNKEHGRGLKKWINGD